MIMDLKDRLSSGQITSKLEFISCLDDPILNKERIEGLSQLPRVK